VLDLSHIRKRIGQSEYAEACAAATKDAERPSYGSGEPGFGSSVPHDIAELIWSSDEGAALDDMERVRLFFTVYDEMPCYGLLMYLGHAYAQLDSPSREYLWACVAERLGGGRAALSNPIQYFLWCDLFEDPKTVEESWKEVLRRDRRSSGLITAVLDASGPVPWGLKRKLFDELIGQPEWHESIFRSVLHSATDVFGQIDRADARVILNTLTIPESTPNLEVLRSRLAE
jgi:hypothetical protein